MGVTAVVEEGNSSASVDATPRPSDQAPLIGGAVRPDWALGDKLFRAQQYFWCCLSMFINFVMSILLPLVFLLKCATYTGDPRTGADIAAIVVEITGLYFVFDLDYKIMEADSSLETRFRYVIRRQKALGLRPPEERPQHLTRAVGITQLLLDFSVKYLLVFALATSWEAKDGTIIGGIPFQKA